MGRRATGVGVGVCFAGMFRGYVSGMFRGIMSYFICNFGGMLRGMFWGYVSGYVRGCVSRVCNPCALLKPEPPKKTQTHLFLTENQCRAMVQLIIAEPCLPYCGGGGGGGGGPIKQVLGLLRKISLDLDC